MKNSHEYSHYILTRFNTQDIGGKMLYDDPKKADKWMEERMELFEKTKESVLNQAGLFQWVISIDDRTPDKFIDEIFTDQRMKRVKGDIRQVFFSRQIKPKTTHVITSRLDNDDLYCEGAVKAIQALFRFQVMVIDIKYRQLDLSTGKEYTSNREAHNSPFLSLVEPIWYIGTCFCRPHSVLGLEYPTPPSGRLKRIHTTAADDKHYAYMVIHGNNVANKIVGEEI